MAVIPFSSCKYNVGIECYKKKSCDKCGWNPDIDKKRKLKLKLRNRGESNV